MEKSIPASHDNNSSIVCILHDKAKASKSYFEGLKTFERLCFWVYLPNTSSDIRSYIKKAIIKFGGKICLSFSPKVNIIVLPDCIPTTKTTYKRNLPVAIKDLAGNHVFPIKQNIASRFFKNKVLSFTSSNEEYLYTLDDIMLDSLLPQMVKSNLKFIYSSNFLNFIEILEIDTLEWHESRGLNISNEKNSVFALSPIEGPDTLTEYALVDLYGRDIIHMPNTEAPRGCSIFQTTNEKQKFQKEKHILEKHYREKIERQMKRKNVDVFVSP